MRSASLLFIFLITLVAVTMSGCSSLLYYPTPQTYIDVNKLEFKPDDVYFTAEDGTRLHAWYFHAKNPKGTVIHFHGNAQNISTHFFFFYWMVKAGYDYFIFDYRGYGLSDAKQPDPECTVRDGKAALRWIAQNRRKDIPLIVLGQSLGSAIALRSAGELSDEVKFDAVVIDSGFVSYKAAAQKIMARSWLTWPFQWLPELVLSDRFGAKDYVRKIAPRPLLVIHGTNDPTIAFSLGKKLFDLAGEPKEFWTIEGGRHTDFVFRENMIYQDKLLTWIEAKTRRK
jgi:alpha-beta hydrolase superfamily lysophospholipase